MEILNKNELECKICGKTAKTWGGYANHIRHFHIKQGHINSLNEYYDKYLLVGKRNLCEYCGNMTPFNGIKYGYKRHCNFECSCKNPISNKYKYEQTKISLKKKYGVEHASHIPGIVEKTKATKLQRYGDENYTNIEKMKNTVLDRYGVAAYTQTIEYKEKLKNTCLDKYGVEHFTQSEIVKNKIKATCLERYGVEYAQQNKEIKQKSLNTSIIKYGGTLHGSELISNKIKSTNVEKYGCEYAQQNKKIQEKTKKTNLIKYGCECVLLSKEILQKLYGVDNVNQLAWVVEKQKSHRLKTLQDKYQVENVSQLAWVQDIIRKNNIKKYGVEFSLQSDIIKDKIKKTCLDKYGVESVMQYEQIRDKCFSSQSRTSWQLKDYILPCGRTLKYQSNTELKFIEMCVKTGIYVDNGDKIQYTTHDGKSHYYYVDFKIKEGECTRLIEIKGKTKWFFESIANGTLFAKIIAAQKYSSDMGYLPFKILFNLDIEHYGKH